MEEFELVARQFSLRLVVLDAACVEVWCQVFLLYKNRIEDLGHNGINKILNSLLQVLSPETFPLVGAMINGSFYGYCMMLYVQMTCAYARQIDSGLEIIFFDRDLQTIATVNLSFEECQSWKEKIMALLNLVC